jgi:hypothetical protein
MAPENTSLTPMDYVPSGTPAIEVGISRDQLASDQPKAESAEIEYQSVPPRRSVKVRVRCRTAERGHALPYPLHQEACE